MLCGRCLDRTTEMMLQLPGPVCPGLVACNVFQSQSLNPLCGTVWRSCVCLCPLVACIGIVMVHAAERLPVNHPAAIIAFSMVCDSGGVTLSIVISSSLAGRPTSGLVNFRSRFLRPSETQPRHLLGPTQVLQLAACARKLSMP